ncbi:MAG: right-handed parallel beta-helix repeat-containing protein [Clostridiaceae bacterium]
MVFIYALASVVIQADYIQDISEYLLKIMNVVSIDAFNSNENETNPDDNSKDVVNSDSQILMDRNSSYFNTMLLNENEKVVKSTNVKDINSELKFYASKGYKIKFKKQIYQLTGTIIIPNEANIDFNNCTIKRKSGLRGFDLIRAENASRLTLSNLLIDGNKAADNLSKSKVRDRFSGLRLKKVTESNLHNITVINTCSGEIQPGLNTAGIILENCNNINLKKINGSYNNGTAILFINSKIKIDESYTHHNDGSGISSFLSDNCEYYNINTHDNGYSNLSVNGKKCVVKSVKTYNSKFSGLNVGHIGQPSDGTIITNVTSYNNNFEGLTISNGKNVQATKIVSYNNKRNNIRIGFGSTNTILDDLTVRNSVFGHGIYYETGVNHVVKNAKIYDNSGMGIYISKNSTVKTGVGLEFYNNSKGSKNK